MARRSRAERQSRRWRAALVVEERERQEGLEARDPAACDVSFAADNAIGDDGVFVFCRSFLNVDSQALKQAYDEFLVVRMVASTLLNMVFFAFGLALVRGDARCDDSFFFT